MSDGGAGAIVEVVSLLAKSKAGRIVLVVIVFYLGLQYAVSQLSRAALAGACVLAAGLVVLVAMFMIRRRRRRERASMYQWLAFFGLVVVAGASALLLIARRRRAPAASAPPPASEVERLVAMEGAVR